MVDCTNNENNTVYTPAAHCFSLFDFLKFGFGSFKTAPKAV